MIPLSFEVRSHGQSNEQVKFTATNWVMQIFGFFLLSQTQAHTITQTCKHVHTHTILYVLNNPLQMCTHSGETRLLIKREGKKKTVASLISIYTNSPLISLTKAPTALFSRLPPFESQCSGLSMAASLIKAAARRRGRPRL